MKLEKRFRNSSGDILVRETDSCGIVEMMYMDGGDTGYVIGYWEVVRSDGDYEGRFQVAGDRLMKIDYDDAEILLDALRIGQEFADLIVRLKYDVRDRDGKLVSDWVIESLKDDKYGLPPKDGNRKRDAKGGRTDRVEDKNEVESSEWVSDEISSYNKYSRIEENRDEKKDRVDE